MRIENLTNFRHEGMRCTTKKLMHDPDIPEGVYKDPNSSSTTRVIIVKTGSLKCVLYLNPTILEPLEEELHNNVWVKTDEELEIKVIPNTHSKAP